MTYFQLSRYIYEFGDIFLEKEIFEMSAKRWVGFQLQNVEERLRSLKQKDLHS